MLVRNPRLLIPTALLFTLLLITVFYFLMETPTPETVVEAKVEGPSPPRLAIFILAANSQTSFQRIVAMYDAWIYPSKRIPPHIGSVKVFLAVGGEMNPYTRTSPVSRLPVIPVPVTKYEEISKKTFGAYRELWEKHAADFDWFMKADDDTFIRPEELLQLLATYPRPQKDDRAGSNWFYLGHPGPYHTTPPQGIHEDFSKDAYCWGGPGYILSWSLLHALGPAWHEWESRVQTFEDVGMYDMIVSVLPEAERRYQGAPLEFGCQDTAHSPPGFSVHNHIDKYQLGMWKEVVDGKPVMKNEYDHIESVVKDVVTFHSVPPEVVPQLHNLYRRLKTQQTLEKGEERV